MAAGLPKVQTDLAGRVRPAHSSLATLSDLAADDAASLSELAVVKRYRQKEMLYSQGERLLGLYLIRHGLVKVIRRTLQGKSRLIAPVGPGGYLPLYLFARSGKYVTTAVALHPTEAAFIEREAFQAWLETHPRVAVKLLEEIGHQFKLTLTEWTRGDYYEGIQQKLAHRLLDAAQEFGILQSDGSVLIDLSLTCQDWADWIGNSRQKVDEVLCNWQRQGVLSRQKRKIVILQEDVLRKFSSE